MPKSPLTTGTEMHILAEELFPICRSITGDSVRRTLRELQKHIPLTIHEVPTGTRAFDWTVPREWNIRDAYVLGPKGENIIDFKEHNLHVVGYSIPVDATMSLAELQVHLHSLPEQPDAIPYVTSYYKEQWGFCLTQKQRDSLVEGNYKVYIDSDIKDGSLTYGELLIPGERKAEIFLSTYACHPSMANDNLSGAVVTVALANWLRSATRRYTYRIIFIPETIGSLVYLSKNLDTMKKNVIAGFNITCVGDDRVYSYLPSRSGNTRADSAALHVLRAQHPDFIRYSFLDRGSDERQYCSPGVDLPVVSVMRSKYAAYPEYHTSLDNLQLVTPSGLQGSVNILKECIEWIEHNPTYRAVHLGEPQLGKRGLHQTIGNHGSIGVDTDLLLNVLTYSDGNHDLPTMAEMLNVSESRLAEAIRLLKKAGLLAES